MTSINPYNFVPLGSRPDRTEWRRVSKHHRLSEETYSGHLMLRFHTITPVFIPSYSQGDVVKERYRNEDEWLTFKRFLRSGENPIIPGTSIKGMIRSVFEALTNSCMVLFAETYGSNCYQVSNYKHKGCSTQDGLCCACSVFGTLLGDDLPFQGKVRFSDAIGTKDDLKKEEWILKELSAPKPEHRIPFYAVNGSNPASGPRGRKFYFHHDPKKVSSENYITQGEHNKRNRKILEHLKAGSSLSSAMDFHGLTEEELGALVYALELEYKNGEKRIEPILAHKIGIGKPLGLGSISILITGGYIEKGAIRYRSLAPQAAQDLRAQIENFRKKASQPSGHLQDLLSLSKYKQGDIKYPGLWFIDPANKKKPLGTWGEFEGTIAQVPEAESDAPISVTETPLGKPPSGLPSDQKTVWLKEIYEKRLVFIDTEGKKIERRINDFQAKKSLLGVGRWYILKGTKSVWPLKKQ
jgi:hypothetical protein